MSISASAAPAVPVPCSVCAAAKRMTDKCESTKTYIDGKYHSFVDWTAKNSYDVRDTFKAADTDCVVRKTTKFVLTMLATIVLFPLAALNVSYQWAKGICWKKPVVVVVTAPAPSSNSSAAAAASGAV